MRFWDVSTLRFIKSEEFIPVERMTAIAANQPFAYIERPLATDRRLEIQITNF
jgi:hypothetical protein